MYELLETQQLVEAKMAIYKASLGDDNDFSKITMMKKYLKMSDTEIKENYENLIKQKMLNELAEFYGGKVAEKGGLEGWDAPIKYKDDVKAEDEDKEEKKEEGSSESSDEGGGESEEESKPEES